MQLAKRRRIYGGRFSPGSRNQSLTHEHPSTRLQSLRSALGCWEGLQDTCPWLNKKPFVSATHSFVAIVMSITWIRPPIRAHTEWGLQTLQVATKSMSAVVPRSEQKRQRFLLLHNHLFNYAIDSPLRLASTLHTVSNWSFSLTLSNLFLCAFFFCVVCVLLRLSPSLVSTCGTRADMSVPLWPDVPWTTKLRFLFYACLKRSSARINVPTLMHDMCSFMTRIYIYAHHAHVSAFTRCSDLVLYRWCFSLLFHFGRHSFALKNVRSVSVSVVYWHQSAVLQICSYAEYYEMNYTIAQICPSNSPRRV